MQIEVIRGPTDDQPFQKSDLHRQVWSFVVLRETRICLIEYAYEARESARHRTWYVRQGWGLGGMRDIPFSGQIAESNVPLPPSVKAAALQQFIATIGVYRWLEKDGPLKP